MRGDRDISEDRHLDEDEDRPRRENKDKQLNGEHDRPRKPHRDRPREKDRERHRKHKTSNVAFEYVFRKAGLTLTVQQSHVLDQDTEAIVNPTDDRLEHVRGLSAAIAKEAGSRLRRESEDIVRRHGPLEVGDVTVTGGGHLSCRYVLHVFGPKSDKHGSRLRDACTSILKKCAKKGIPSIAIPCVGSGGDTGNYARAMSDAIRHYVDHQTKKGGLHVVNLVDTDPKGSRHPGEGDG
ncbi:hypothetical protein LSAT2_015569 [Lamellibrachia satsuma]|nr:hypothetical protein LSAT2_015569 [Lamellibrachia satsuma]